MKYLSALLWLPYAAGVLAGWIVLFVVVVWLAVLDGYHAGRGR